MNLFYVLRLFSDNRQRSLKLDSNLRLSQTRPRHISQRRCAGALFFLFISTLLLVSWMKNNTFDVPRSWMSLTAAVPIAIGLGARILFNSVSRTPGASGYFDQSSSSSTGDYIVQGLFQGALLQYVFSEFPSFAPALAVAFVARALLDFSSQNNIDKLSFTFISALGGAAASYALTAALAEGFQESSGVSVVTDEEEEEPPRIRSSDRRKIRREHARARLQEVNRKREPSVPRRDMSFVTDETATSSLELTGYTGLGRLVDLQLGNLRKKAAIAEADRRRCKEEKKWALAQGDKSRATQLSWQIKRYAAMAESYTREADRRIIEGMCFSRLMFICRCSDCSPSSVARASGNGNAANMGQNADQYTQRYGEQRYGEHYPQEQRYPQEQHYPQDQRYQPDQRYPQEQQRYEEQHQQYYTHNEPAYNPMMGAQPPPPEERHYTRAECVLSYDILAISSTKLSLQERENTD